MKRIFLFAALAAGMLQAQAAGAQVFGQYTGARTIGVDTRLFGAYMSFTDKESELMTQLRLSYYPNIDFGFQGGLSKMILPDHNSTAVKLGGDMKALVRAARFDFSLGAALGLISADEFNVLQIGPQAVLSRKFGADPVKGLTAYAAALVLFSRSDIADVSNTDTSTPIRLGAEWAPGHAVRVVVEYQLALSDQITEDHKLTLGANFPF